MATPSSSVTSPSPPIPYLAHPSQAQPSSSSAASHALDKEQRKKAVDKFLARAEISMVTRALRARLSYASYKATHNIPHIPLPELEAQSQPQPASHSRSAAAKRKAVAATAQHNNTATQGAGNANPVNARRSQGTMPPPASTSSRLAIHAAPGTPSHSAYSEAASSSRNPHPQGPSLYTSLLSPPPTKLARTIHNVNDPPVPPPTRPVASARARVPKSPRGDGPRSQSKVRTPNRSSKLPASPERRRAKRPSQDKGKGRRPDDMDVDADGDVDMAAAATLTSLLMHHHRPSLSASSPRSSIDGSDVTSAYSFSHYNQSSARSSALTAPPISAATSSSGTSTEPATRPQTPPMSGTSPQMQLQQQHGTPRPATATPAATDNEAASLMLFLATSPSPVRPSDKDAKDRAAFRALGGGANPLRAKGRVLFPTTPAAAAGAEHLGGGNSNGNSNASSNNSSMVLAREDSFGGSPALAPTSGVGGGGSHRMIKPPRGEMSIGAETGGYVAGVGLGAGHVGGPFSNILPEHTVSTELEEEPMPVLTIADRMAMLPANPLLPPAVLPALSGGGGGGGGSGSAETVPRSPGRKAKEVRPGSGSGSGSSPRPVHALATTSGPTDFNIHEFINASPSPATTSGPGKSTGSSLSSSAMIGGGHKPNLGLRADVGRKLFEEEQLRHAQSVPVQAGKQVQPTVGDQRTLGAGIDLVSTS